MKPDDQGVESRSITTPINDSTTTDQKNMQPERPKRTDFVLNRIERLLHQSHTDEYTNCARLSDARLVSFKTELNLNLMVGGSAGDGGGGGSDTTWGCGYRNLQTMFSSLLFRTEYQTMLSSHPLLSSSTSSNTVNTTTNDDNKEIFNLVPSINKWQSIIEDAWKSGFDPLGSLHFSKKLVGKKSWIGTTEVYTALNRLGIRCQIVDFVLPNHSNRRHTKLMKWVLDYFESDLNDNDKNENEGENIGGEERKDSKIRITKKFPLYFQHQGHSRTIIGIEVDSKDQYNLLVLDPGRSLSKSLKKGASNTSKFNTQRILNQHRLNLRKLSKHLQYQILYIRQDLGNPLPFHIDEPHQSKFHQIESIRIS